MVKDIQRRTLTAHKLAKSNYNNNAESFPNVLSVQTCNIRVNTEKLNNTC